MAGRGGRGFLQGWRGEAARQASALEGIQFRHSGGGPDTSALIKRLKAGIKGAQQSINEVNSFGSEAGAALLQARAAELQNLRPSGRVVGGKFYPGAKELGTTAVVKVRHIGTGDIKTWIAREGPGAQPTQWKGVLQGEDFIQGPGHAEETIINNLGAGWEIIEGGTSRNVCLGICAPGLIGNGLSIGGPTFPGKSDKTSYRMFWRTGDN